MRHRYGWWAGADGDAIDEVKRADQSNLERSVCHQRLRASFLFTRLHQFWAMAGVVDILNQADDRNVFGRPRLQFS
jgi:hypothetical protein